MELGQTLLELGVEGGLGLEEQENLGIVFHLSLPCVDGAGARNNRSAGGEFFFDQCARGGRSRVGVGKTGQDEQHQPPTLVSRAFTRS